MPVRGCARARKDTTVPQDEIPALPLPTEPRDMVLLGKDLDRDKYHYEGPFGLPFETASKDALFGWLKGWTRRVRNGSAILLHQFRIDEPWFYIMGPDVEALRYVRGEDDVFLVINKRTGYTMKIHRNYLFVISDDSRAHLEELKMKKSPYSVSNFETGGVNSLWMH